jgi:deazaflavin-dependent oxidoreductase (nitroreductase family)
MNAVKRALQNLVSTKGGTWIYLNIVPHFDRPLLRLSRGRISLAPGQPVCLLQTIGAKSGEERSTPLVYTADGDDLILIASYGGSSRNPAWYYNLLAYPEPRVSLGGWTRTYTARELEGEERERRWRQACDAYLGFEKYRVRAGSRKIPVMLLSPTDD